MWVPAIIKRTLMGVPYSYAAVESDRPLPPRRIALEQPRADLDRHERLIAEHRRHDVESYAAVLPRAAIEPLLRADEATCRGNADAQRRRELAVQSERMDAPVLPSSGTVQTLSTTELSTLEAERRRQIRRDECSIVPVMRRRAV